MISDVHTDLQLPSSGAPSSYIKDRGRETMKHLLSIMIKNAEVPRIKEVEKHPACVSKAGKRNLQLVRELRPVKISTVVETDFMHVQKRVRPSMSTCFDTAL